MAAHQTSAGPVNRLGSRFFLEQKLSLVKQFFSLTESLREALDLPELEHAMGLVEERQALIGRMDRTDEEMRVLEPAFMTEGGEEETRSLLKAIQDILGRAVTLDRECLMRMRSLREESKLELTAMRNGFMAVRRYASRETCPPRFLDRRR